MVMTLTFTCMCKDENDGSRRRHECTAEDNRRKDVPGYFQFLCSECSWHAARCLLCDKLHQWDKTSSVTAAKRGSRVYLHLFQQHCKTHHTPQEEDTHQQEEPNKRQQLDEYGESTTYGVVEEEGTFTADHPDCDVTFDCETSEKREGEATSDKERTTKREQMNRACRRKGPIIFNQSLMKVNSMRNDLPSMLSVIVCNCRMNTTSRQQIPTCT